VKTAFKSYAQNFEDLMLYRALGHLERGFYIDIGAQHPEIDSVSKAFFDRGWQGVHVEPVPHYANLLREARPGDRVIEAAVSNRVGHTTLIVFPDTGLSTTVPDIAAGHVDAGMSAPEDKLEVPTVTLASIAEELGESEVHWLKIDVEGLEKEVLQGWDPRLAAALARRCRVDPAELVTIQL
jgi:FkbM family methyltransferase